MDNNFQVDTSKQVKKDFLKKTEIPLGIAFLLTGIETVAAILFFIKGISGAVWNEMGVYEFAVKSLHFASIVCIFLCLIKLIVDGKPFSHSFSICTRIIAVYISLVRSCSQEYPVLQLTTQYFSSVVLH